MPPPDPESPLFVSWYVNVVGVGTERIVKVPLYRLFAMPFICTTCPTVKPCDKVVVIVTVLPDSVAPEGEVPTNAVVQTVIVAPPRGPVCVCTTP